jgi:hypothetical protein
MGDCEEISNEGHTHIYLLDDYPACLEDCNFGYLTSIKPPTDDAGSMIEGEVEGTNFEETGTFTLSAGLQFNEHFPWPTPEDVVYDAIPITIED